MNYLLLDCTGNNLLAAVVKEGRVFDGSVLCCGRDHSTKVISAIQKAMSLAELSFDDLDCYACAVGTGSFTGIRIGVSTIKGLNCACKKKLIGFNVLNVLAFQCEGETNCYMDAGNGLYHAVYNKEQCLVEPHLIDYDANASGVFYDTNENYLQYEIELVDRLIKNSQFCESLKPLYIRKSQAEVNKK